MSLTLHQKAPEISPALIGNPITRHLIRLAATTHLRPLGKRRAARFGVRVNTRRIANVRVKHVQPRSSASKGDRRLLINFHGGGFVVDAGSLTETIPIAGLTAIPVTAVMYRMAPEHPFPAAVDDALAVYRDALSKRPAQSIGIFGTSAGAILTVQLLVRLKQEGLPLPAAAGFFSGSADFSRVGDIEAFLPSMRGEREGSDNLSYYTGATPRTDPLLSPMYGDLSGLPPMLLMSSTRDQLLSHTVLADLALRQAGVNVDLRIYEGMMHAFWAWIECPETEAAFAAQAEFFLRHLE